MKRLFTLETTRPVAIAALALALSASALIGCEERADHREVLMLVDELNASLEERDVRGLMRHTTADFMFFPGRLDTRSATKRAFIMFRLHGAVEALYPRPEIEMDGDRAARVSGPLLLVRRGTSVPELEDLEHDPDAWLERAAELGNVIHAELSLVLSGERWLVQTARFH